MNENTDFYDVIVFGAGTAGSIAALQSARCGAKTLLIEKNGMPGGTITSGGVSFPGLFHAWGKQVISGIGWDLVLQAVNESDGVLPDFTLKDQPHWRQQIRINPGIYSCLLDEAFTKDGVEVLYHAMPFEVHESESCITVKVAVKEGMKEFKCATAVDASGDASLIEEAGFRVIKNKEKQPATPIISLSGYDFEKLDLDKIEAAYKEALKNGELEYLDTGLARSMNGFLNSHGKNSIHINADSADTSKGRSKAEQKGRAAILRLYRFLKRQPGLEKLELEYMAPECGIRETAVIVGEKTVTVDDYTSGRVWEDSLCYAFYPIDLHQQDKDSSLLKRKLTPGTVPSIPRGALIPEGSKRFLAAGRCVSSDRLANSALRVQAACMAMGQAAGALAALASKKGVAPSELEIESVKEVLTANKAIVP